MTAAEKFRYFRHAKGITQQQLAIALGITRRAVVYIESGQREPRIETERKFQELVNKHQQESGRFEVNFISDEVLNSLEDKKNA